MPEVFRFKKRTCFCAEPHPKHTTPPQPPSYPEKKKKKKKPRLDRNNEEIWVTIVKEILVWVIDVSMPMFAALVLSSPSRDREWFVGSVHSTT
jgi:hypothetical protein